MQDKAVIIKNLGVKQMYVLARRFNVGTAAHRLDPRAKLAVVGAVWVAAFASPGVAVGSVMCVAIAAAVAYASRSASVVVRLARLMLVVVVVAVALHAALELLSIVRPTGREWLVSSGTLLRGLGLGLRVAALIGVTQWFVATTDPGDLTSTLVRPFRFSRRVRTFADGVATSTAVAIRLLPVISRDVGRVRMAHRARGIGGRGTFGRLRGLSRLFVPTFATAFRRADELSDAMTVRGYVPGQVRTEYRPLRFRAADGFVALASVSVAVLSVVFGKDVALWLI
jgi:energy-coupling factor transport system permease protein